MPSDLPSELARWFQNMQRMLDRLAQAAEEQNQLHATVARLLGENEELRAELERLRGLVARLAGQRAETARILRGLAAYVTAVRDQLPRQSGDGP